MCHDSQPAQSEEAATARRKCMERLLLQLSEDGVSQAGSNREVCCRTGRTKRWLRPCAQQEWPSRVYGSIARPLDEPMLWIPDPVAGAVASAKKGTDTYRQALGAGLVELEISL